MNNIAKDQNDTERQKYQEPTHEFIKAWFGLFSFVTAKRKPTNQNESSIFLLRYDFVVVQRGRPIVCLEYHHFAALKACSKSAKIS